MEWDFCKILNISPLAIYRHTLLTKMATPILEESEGRSCVLDTNGDLFCWRINVTYASGNNSYPIPMPAPQHESGAPSNIATISAGYTGGALWTTIKPNIAGRMVTLISWYCASLHSLPECESATHNHCAEPSVTSSSSSTYGEPIMLHNVEFIRD